MKNRKMSEASKQKMREAKLGKPRSEEAKEKIRLGSIKRWRETQEKLEKLKRLEAMLKQ